MFGEMKVTNDCILGSGSTIKSKNLIKSSIFTYVCCVGLIYLSACTVLCTGTPSGTRHDVSSSPLNCSTDHTRTLIITTQTQLDNFMQSISSPSNQTIVCLNVILDGGDFLLDLPQLMTINLGTNGSLVIMADGMVNITCTSNVTDPEMLRRTVQPISHVWLISFDGLVLVECPVPILIEEVAMVVILNCVFIGNQHGSVNIFNSPTVIVKNCTFLNNTATSYFTRQPYQTNAGGLSVGYNDRLVTRPLNIINITITNCTFTNNHAGHASSPNEVQQQRIFSGRGGGLSIVVNATTVVQCIVNDSLFVNNSAENIGGAVYFSISESSTLHQLYMLRNNTFTMNTAPVGGGYFFANLVVPEEGFYQGIILHTCVFINNTATIGGGVSVFSSLGLSGSYIRYEGCHFYKNSATLHGGAVDIVSYNLYGNREQQGPAEFVNCYFSENFGTDGATVSLNYYSGRFDNVTFKNHRGSVVRTVAGILHFTGPATFVDNDAGTFDGGAVHLLSLGQIVVNPGADLMFTNNSGRNGAALVSNRASFPAVFERTYFNPLCFIRYSSATVPPEEWSQVSMNFTGNKAVIGSAIYTSELALCSWYSYFPPYFYFNTSSVLRQPFMSYGTGNTNTGHDIVSSTDESLALQTPAVDFVLLNQSIKAFPGEMIKLVILSFDEQNYPTSDTIQILDRKNEGVSLEFTPSASALQPSNPTINVKFSVSRISNEILNTAHRIEVSAFRELSAQVQYFNLTITSCPPGHVLHSTGEEDEYECQCDDVDDQNIVSCVPEENKIILEEGQWAHRINVGSVNGMLEYYYCPPGYCQCSRVDGSSSICNNVYHYDDDDRQCVCDRKGDLCGKCRGEKAVSALLNKCVSCGKASILLVIVLVVIDIITITIILVFSMKIRSWLYPFLFYLQIAPYIAQYFPVTFAAVQPYLHYISSAASLYFPYDFCLYPGMTALVSYNLRYIPLLLTLIISLVLFTGNKKLKLGKNMKLSWSGLWVLTVLLSTSVLNTSFSILNCPSLSDDSGNKKLRWFIDGTVECFVGGHLPLAIVAILTLMFYMMSTIFLVAVVMKKIKRYWAFSMAKLLHEPYTNQYKWWAPLELIRRCVFIILITALPGNLDGIFTNQQDLTTHFIDGCGVVQKISDHIILIIPFYYLPFVLMLVVVTVKVLATIKTIVAKRIESQQGIVTEDIETELITSSVAMHYWEF
ncbi:uncharacterized protein [Dysidea avara]|uniref:uncharacterized protein isoform X2 n=1 Tax=Dysidea avara TaxID=196820 RepID=UPI00332FCCE9